MKLRLLHRTTALVWALAFVLGTVGEGFGLYPCPHHGGASSEIEEAASHGGHGAHEGAAALHHHGGETPADSHSGPCTCGSVCQAGTAVVLPVGPPAEIAADVASVSAASAPRSEVGSIRRPPHFLPFGHAPPRQG